MAEHTNEVVQLCEAGGHDVVIVESVGLGQVPGCHGPALGVLAFTNGCVRASLAVRSGDRLCGGHVDFAGAACWRG